MILSLVILFCSVNIGIGFLLKLELELKKEKFVGRKFEIYPKLDKVMIRQCSWFT